jgi:DNA-binding NtrC family response regulator
MPKPAVLMVDAESDICELLSIRLKRMSLAPRITGLVGAAQRLLNERFDLCLTDYPGARHYDEHQRRAAKMLGIAFRALRYRVKKLGIE